MGLDRHGNHTWKYKDSISLREALVWVILIGVIVVAVYKFIHM